MFIDGLSNELKIYLLTLPETNTVEGLCERAARRVMIFQQYPEEDGGSASNELSSSQVDTLLASLTENGKTQTAMRKRETSSAQQTSDGQHSWGGRQQQQRNTQSHCWNWQNDIVKLLYRTMITTNSTTTTTIEILGGDNWNNYNQRVATTAR